MNCGSPSHYLDEDPVPVSSHPAVAALRPSSQTRRLIEKYGLRCCWCGRICNPEVSPDCDAFPTREHLVRRADGGRSRMENLRIACRKCNNTRHRENRRAERHERQDGGATSGWNNSSLESLKLFWKAHAARDFLSGNAPQDGNGVGRGGDLFKDFNVMVAAIGRESHWVCPVLMFDDEVDDLGGGIFRSKVGRIGNGFHPVSWWEDRDVSKTPVKQKSTISEN